MQTPSEAPNKDTQNETPVYSWPLSYMKKEEFKKGRLGNNEYNNQAQE